MHGATIKMTETSSIGYRT